VKEKKMKKMRIMRIMKRVKKMKIYESKIKTLLKIKRRQGKF
jgi:hypothetical protein